MSNVTLTQDQAAALLSLLQTLVPEPEAQAETRTSGDEPEGTYRNSAGRLVNAKGQFVAEKAKPAKATKAKPAKAQAITLGKRGNGAVAIRSLKPLSELTGVPQKELRGMPIEEAKALAESHGATVTVIPAADLPPSK